MIEDYSKIGFSVPECVKDLDPTYFDGGRWTNPCVDAWSDGRRLDFIKPGMIGKCYVSAPYYSSSHCLTVKKVDDNGFYFNDEDYVLWEQIGRIMVKAPSEKELGLSVFAKYGSRAFDSKIPEDAREGLCSAFNDKIEFLTEKVEGTYHEWELD